MALPKAGSVVELYREHPETWIKGHTFADDRYRKTTHDKATKCCLLGAIAHIYGYENEGFTSEEMKRAEALLSPPQFSLTDINDDPGTTLDDVIKFAERAQV